MDLIRNSRDTLQPMTKLALLKLLRIERALTKRNLWCRLVVQYSGEFVVEREFTEHGYALVQYAGGPELDQPCDTPTSRMLSERKEREWAWRDVARMSNPCFQLDNGERLTPAQAESALRRVRRGETVGL